MAISFPGSKSNGQKFTSGNKSWTWNGSAWKGSTSSGSDAVSLGGVTASSFLRSDSDDITSGKLTIDSTGQLYVRYNNSDSYRAGLDWNVFQLGNNGQNKLVAGKNTVGGYFQFYVNNTSDVVGGSATDGTASMALAANGNVGIGETVPLGKLHVKDGDAGTISTNSAHDTFVLEGSGNTGINIFSPNTSYQYLAFGDPEGSNSGYVRYQHSTNQMVLRAGANDIVFIDDDHVTIDGTGTWNAGNGMLNIGGAGDGRLQVRHIWGKSASSAGTDHLWVNYSNPGQHVQIGASGDGNDLYVSGNIYANGYFTGNRVLTQADEGSGNGLDADTLDGVQGTGYLSNGLVANKAQILMLNRFNGNSTGISWYDDAYNSWVMYMAQAGQTSVGPRGNLTAPTGSIVTSWAQRSHIENGGGYGWTFESQSNASTSPIVRFEIRSSDGSAYSQGNITAAGNITANSDISLKDNIEAIPGALDKVLQIRGVTYNRNDIEDNPRQTGVIAQEVEKVLPEVISEDANGIKSVAYGNMIGLLIEAIKEQQERIDALEERLNADNT